MENQHEPVIRLEMDIADFSGKTVNRIDIQNVILRADTHKAGIAIVMTFTDGATGTILVSSREGAVSIDSYARPRMAGYSIVEEADVAVAP